MDRRMIGWAISLVFILAITLLFTLSPAPTIMAAEDNASGTATVSNEGPSVTTVAITDMDGGAVGTLNPGTYYKVKVTVSDANSLQDISNIVVKMYLEAKGETASDAERDHYTFKYTAGTPTWEETGPDPTTDSHINPAGCVEPSPLTAASGTYVFQVKLAYIAEPTTGENWTAKAIATDSDSASGSNTETFGVNDYISLSIDDSTLTFSGAPGATDVAPGETPTVATVTSNNNFDIKVKLGGDWIGVTYTDESIPAGNTEVAQDAGKTTGVQTLSTSYKILWPNVGYGKDLTKDCYWFLDIPSPCRNQAYNVTAFIQVVLLA